jgi:hypothetical protein
MARSNPTENQGGDEAGIDPRGASRGGTAGLNVDLAALRSLSQGIQGLTKDLKDAASAAKDLADNVNRAGGGNGGGRFGRIAGMLGGSSGRTAMPEAGTVAAGITGGSKGGGRTATPTATGGTGGGGPISGILQGAQGVASASMKPLSDLNSYMNQRIGQGSEYSLQADRMSVQLQQMYGMSNASVRNQLRMPLTSNYLLGGGNAINELLNMQANTGLTAAKQASTVEAFRTVSGFSYGAGDVTKMLTSMASPDTANRMFMMGGTGMYGIGGKERTGMQSIQDIVKRSGLTNPDALKGALQQGSNTRQRLSAMGVSGDMQDMVIQYAMQNNQYQKKSGTDEMYDPSTEQDRRTMGIEGSYAVQHEKTTGERIKREERFYGRQVDNFADFERNLRSTTKILAAFEDALSGIIGAKISYGNHPLMKAANYGVQQGMNVVNAQMQFAASLGDAAVGLAPGMGGDPVDGNTGAPTPPSTTTKSASSASGALPEATERKLSKLDPKLAVPLRKMLSERPDIGIGDTIRSNDQQRQGFLARYRRSSKTEKTHETDRVWNGEVWEMKPEALAKNIPAMAPPGQSYHEKGLAADLDIQGSAEQTEWVKRNAGRFGLDTGATGRGGSADEPFHVQPKGTGLSSHASKPGNKTISPVAVKFTKSEGGRGATRLTRLANTGSVTSSAPIAQVNYQAPYRGNTGQVYGEGTVNKASSSGGDPIDGGMSMGMSGGSGGSPSIVISPTIYLQGGQNMATDMHRIAKEVGRLLENEVKLSMMRGS